VRAQGTFHLYSTCEIDTDHPHYVFTQDVSDRIAVFAQGGRIVALQRAHETVVMVGNVNTSTVNVPLDLSSVLEPDAKYHVRMYNSERDDWETDAVLAREEVATLTATIESQGYRVLHLTRVDE